MATHAQLSGILPRPLPTVAEVADGLRRHELVTRACAIAFRILFAVVPFALFLLALAGLLSQQELWTEDLAPSIGPHVSTSLFAVLDDVAINALSARQVFWTTAGLTLAIWEVSSAERVVMGCLDDIYGARRRRSFAERLPTSLWLGPACGVVVVGAGAHLHPRPPRP